MANASGTSTITVTVTDTDGASATRSFVLTVSAVNDAPTISTISAQTTLENTATGAIPFTLGDLDKAWDSLVVTATSSNQGVVATNGIVLDGGYTNRTITLTPVANAIGTSMITVTVADGSGGTASQTFEVMVTAIGELLVNGQFSLLDPNSSLKPLAWESTQGWVAFTGGNGNDEFPSVHPAGLLAFGWSADVVVSQTLTLPQGMISGLSSFELRYRLAKNQQSGVYWVQAEFLSGPTVVATLRKPVSGTEAAPSDWTTYSLELRRDTVPDFDQISQVRVSLFGQQFPYVWAGHYGPFFDFVSLSARTTAPTISEISDRTTLEDTATGAIPFTVGDAETAATALTVTATSSDLSVVATNGIVLGGSGANRTLTLSPVANASGTSTITVTVTDGSGGAAIRSFLLTVTAMNDAPKISTISAQTTLANTATGAIEFTVGDAEMSMGLLTVTATSSNQGVVATNGIMLDGWHTNRTITLTPVANASGTSTITVTVTDAGGLTATRSFVLTVTAVNDAPTISTISVQTTVEDTATSAIAFTVGDVETAAGSLTVTATSSNLSVVATNGITLGGSGANRTITLTPVANASGTSTITVTVTDAGGASATNSFVLIVTPVSDVPEFEGFLLGAGLMPVVGGDGRYRLEASLGQAIAGSLLVEAGLDLSSGFWFLDRLADALPGQMAGLPTPAQAAKGLVLQRATVAASHTDRLSSGTTPQMASGVRLQEARIRVAAVGDTAKVRILVSGQPKARWRVHSREGFGTGSWRDDGILQLDGEGEGFLETSGGDASAMRFYRLVQP